MMTRMFRSGGFSEPIRPAGKSIPNVATCPKCGGTARVAQQSWLRRLFAPRNSGLFRCYGCGNLFRSTG